MLINALDFPTLQAATIADNDRVYVSGVRIAGQWKSVTLVQ